jgi:hypothetical protein
MNEWWGERWGLSLCFICFSVLLLHAVVLYIYMCREVKQAMEKGGHTEMRVQAVRVFICLFYMSRFCNSNKKVCRRMHIYKCVPAFGLVWLVRVRMVKI